MTHDELIGKMEDLFAVCADLARQKNKDYAGKNDALENFRDFGFLGVIIRMNDKFKRLKNIVKNKGTAVSGETIRDTLKDIINYGAIAIIMKEEEEGSDD